MAVIRSSDHPELLDIPLSKVFVLPFKAKAEYPRLFDVVNTSMAYEDSIKHTEFGPVPQKSEGGLTHFENIVSSEVKRITPLEFALGYIITRKMRDDDQHAVMVGLTRALRRSFRYLYEVRSYRILNNATGTDSEFLGLDGKSLINTAHPLQGGGTQSNRPATDTDLTSVAAEAAIVNFSGVVGEKNLPAMIVPKIVVSRYNNQYDMARIFRNAMLAGTTDNDENWIKQGPNDNPVSEYVSSVYLTDTNAWFMADKPSDRPNDAVLRVRVAPEFKVGADFRSDNFLARGYTRIESGFHNYYHWYGSTGSS